MWESGLGTGPPTQNSWPGGCAFPLWCTEHSYWGMRGGGVPGEPAGVTSQDPGRTKVGQV